MRKKTKPTTKRTKQTKKVIRFNPFRAADERHYRDLEILALDQDMTESTFLDFLREKGVLYDAPGQPWHNLPLPAYVDNGIFKVKTVFIETWKNCGFLDSLFAGSIRDFMAPKGRTGLRLEGGSYGEHLFRLRTFEEYEKDWFDIF